MPSSSSSTLTCTYQFRVKATRGATFTQVSVQAPLTQQGVADPDYDGTCQSIDEAVKDQASALKSRVMVRLKNATTHEQAWTEVVQDVVATASQMLTVLTNNSIDDLVCQMSYPALDYDVTTPDGTRKQYKGVLGKQD